MCGSDGAAEVDRTLRERFEAIGYATTELPFGFSTWPGRFGLPFAGAVMAIGGGVGAWLLYADLPVAAVSVLLVAAAVALLPLLLLGRVSRRMPWGRVETANLLFQRSGTRPAWIVMAHRDSKSQLVPTLLRTAALVAVVAGWALLLVLAGLWYAGGVFRFPGATIALGALLVLAGLVLALSWAANASPGALDNASGMAALLGAAKLLGDRSDVAFLLTDGEELGLAGARAVVEDLPPVQGVINVDGLDDDGRFIVAEGRGWRRRGTAPQLAAALLVAAEILDYPIERRPLPRSLLVDHLPIAAAGIPALTLLRGGWGSLMRVHRPGDSADRLNGRGSAEGATLLAAAFRILRGEPSSHLAADQTAGP